MMTRGGIVTTARDGALRACRAGYRQVLLGTVVTVLSTLPAIAYAMDPDSPEHEGMPQLNFANPLTTSQVVWMALILLAFYLLLSKWALPQVSQVVDDRNASIMGDLDSAHLAKAEANAAVEEMNDAIRRANLEGQAEIEKAVSAAKAKAQQEAAEAHARLERQLADAEARIASSRDTAMGALRDVATDTTQALIARLTGQFPAQDAVEQAVGQALAARS
ncbi:ATP synthase B' chain [Granulibacter bethesdensis]|nr:ATP synthase B' chain [Granulibacter bethesdensis]